MQNQSLGTAVPDTHGYCSIHTEIWSTKNFIYNLNLKNAQATLRHMCEMLKNCFVPLKVLVNRSKCSVSVNKSYYIENKVMQLYVFLAVYWLMELKVWTSAGFQKHTLTVIWCTGPRTKVNSLCVCPYCICMCWRITIILLFFSTGIANVSLYWSDCSLAHPSLSYTPLPISDQHHEKPKKTFKEDISRKVDREKG